MLRTTREATPVALRHLSAANFAAIVEGFKNNLPSAAHANKKSPTSTTKTTNKTTRPRSPVRGSAQKQTSPQHHTKEEEQEEEEKRKQQEQEILQAPPKGWQIFLQAVLRCTTAQAAVSYSRKRRGLPDKQFGASAHDQTLLALLAVPSQQRRMLRGFRQLDAAGNTGRVLASDFVTAARAVSLFFWILC